jgi:hypothetical protein
MSVDVGEKVSFDDGDQHSLAASNLVLPLTLRGDQRNRFYGQLSGENTFGTRKRMFSRNTMSRRRMPFI